MPLGGKWYSWDEVQGNAPGADGQGNAPGPVGSFQGRRLYMALRGVAVLTVILSAFGAFVLVEAGWDWFLPAAAILQGAAVGMTLWAIATIGDTVDESLWIGKTRRGERGQHSPNG